MGCDTREVFEMMKRPLDTSKWKQPRVHKNDNLHNALCGAEVASHNKKDRLRNKWSSITCKACLDIKNERISQSSIDGNLQKYKSYY